MKTIGVINPDRLTPRSVHQNLRKTSGVITFPVLKIQSYFKTGNLITPLEVTPHTSPAKILRGTRGDEFNDEDEG